MEQIKGFVFDLDGLLTKSEQIYFISWSPSLKLRGADLTKEEYIEHCAGNTTRYIGEYLIREKKLDVDIDTLMHEKEYFVDKCLEFYGVEPFADAKYVFEKSVESGLYVSIATGGTDSATNIKLDSAGLIDLVRDEQIPIVNADTPEVKQGKPAPDMYRIACEKMKVRYADNTLAPQHCVGFDDTAAGVQSAADAGLISVAVPTEWSASQQFSHLTKRIYNSMTQAINALGKEFILPKEVYP